MLDIKSLRDSNYIFSLFGPQKRLKKSPVRMVFKGHGGFLQDFQNHDATQLHGFVIMTPR